MTAEILIPFLILSAGIGLLIKGADFIVEGGGGLAKRYGVSPTTVGFTVIAFGTSLPEFVVSINAVISNNADIALGNVLGSNIANVALVLAIAAILKPGLISLKGEGGEGLKPQLILMFLATLLFLVLAMRGVLDLLAGILLLTGFAVILRFLSKKTEYAEGGVRSHGRKDYFYTIGGLVALVIGSRLVLEGAVSIATILNIPAFVIGLSVVAVGTSLPELATSVMAIIRGSGGISAGNIFGSNIFNLLLVLGCAALIRPILIPSITDVIITVAFTFAILPLFSRSDGVTRCWAMVMLIGYAGYIGFVFGVI